MGEMVAPPCGQSHRRVDMLTFDCELENGYGDQGSVMCVLPQQEKKEDPGPRERPQQGPQGCRTGW